jgi:2-polyprenyl-3-methyl-5-hydroxy-6-metoxy-1,4-benzoquinol methylase
VQEARSLSRRDNVEFMETDLFDLESDDLFDVVFCVDVIEHMPMEQGREFIAAMARHLKPTGMLITGTPSIYSYQYQSPESKASHIKCYDQQELLAMLDQYFGRTLSFTMNDEMVHTGHSKMAWYYFFISLLPGMRPNT